MATVVLVAVRTSPTNDEDDYYMCEEQAIQLCNELGKHRWQYWRLEVVGRYRGWNIGHTLDYLWCDRANALKLVPINGNPSREPVVLYPYKFWDTRLQSEHSHGVIMPGVPQGP